MNHFDAVKKTLQFNGRISRKDFWLAMLTWFVFTAGVTVIFISSSYEAKLKGWVPRSTYGLSIMILISVIPLFSLIVRRLHDANFSVCLAYVSLGDEYFVDPFLAIY